MRYSRNSTEPKFRLDLSKANKMHPKDRIVYYDQLISDILTSDEGDKVKFNLQGTIYEISGTYIPLFIECQKERDIAKEDLKRMERISPTCSIDWDVLKKLPLEEKIEYLEELIERIENAEITDPYIYSDGEFEHVINRKDLAIFKACQKELEKKVTLYLAKQFINDSKAILKEAFNNSKESIKAEIESRKKKAKKKVQKISKKIRGSHYKGRIMRGMVKTSDLKRCGALACAVCFAGNMTLSSLGEGVSVNEELLRSLPANASFMLKRDSEEKENITLKIKKSPDETKVSTISYDFCTGEAILTMAEEEPSLSRHKTPSQMSKEESSYVETYGRSTQYRTPEQEVVLLDLSTEVSESDKRNDLIDSYLEEYSLYFNMDKNRVITLAREATDDYKNGFLDIIGEVRADISDEETACLVFVYRLYRNKLAISLEDFGFKASDFKNSDGIYGKGREEGETLILRNGETENQFMTRISKMIGLDETYSLPISLTESGRFQSSMCRNKNNYGGMRATKEYMTFPSPEAGIIAFCMNLKGYEKYELDSLSSLCQKYVFGRKLTEEELNDENVLRSLNIWMKNVGSFHRQILADYEEYTGYPLDGESLDEEAKVPTLELY